MINESMFRECLPWKLERWSALTLALLLVPFFMQARGAAQDLELTDSDSSLRVLDVGVLDVNVLDESVGDVSSSAAILPGTTLPDPDLHGLELSNLELPSAEPVITGYAHAAQPIPDSEMVIEEIVLEPTESIVVAEDESEKNAVRFGDWLGYNSKESDTSWLVGHGDDLGIFSMQSFPTLDVGEDQSLLLGTSIHWVDGPIATDLPPRLYDLHIAYHTRSVWSDSFIFDVRFGVGAFTDFEGSVRKGIRFPGHVVSYYQWHPWLVTLLGAEALDRDDISVLPVAGFVWRPRDDLVYEIVFPRPKIQVRTKNGHAVYLAGELGGDTWAIERSNATNDNATYRDLRLVLGFMDFDDEDDSSLELGWAFDRKLQYRSGVGNYKPDDAFILRFRTHY